MEMYGNKYGSEVLAAVGGQEQVVSNAPRLPDKKFKAGGLTATVWKGISQKGTYFSVQLAKSYKDKENNWKTTSSLRENEVPKAVVLLQKAYEYVISQQANSALN